jgi:hypothetical protein
MPNVRSRAAGRSDDDRAGDHGPAQRLPPPLTIVAVAAVVDDRDVVVALGQSIP